MQSSSPAPEPAPERTADDASEALHERPAVLRWLAFGVLAGALVSALRAPVGLDLLRTTFVDAGTAALFRAAALLGINRNTLRKKLTELGIEIPR